MVTELNDIRKYKVEMVSRSIAKVRAVLASALRRLLSVIICHSQLWSRL